MFTLEKLPDEYRTEAVTLMVRISPVVSRHVVQAQFLPRFCDLCSESLFHIRKVCATSIGEMCRVVGPDLAEKYLLPKFFNLCEDGIWGVRKACTECFMQVSNSLPLSARRNDLAQLFVGLLCDQSRWVRMSAFQALGPFISTFADPDMTGLYFDQDGILRVCEKELLSTPTVSQSPQPVNSPEQPDTREVESGSCRAAEVTESSKAAADLQQIESTVATTVYQKSGDPVNSSATDATTTSTTEPHKPNSTEPHKPNTTEPAAVSDTGGDDDTRNAAGATTEGAVPADKQQLTEEKDVVSSQLSSEAQCQVVSSSSSLEHTTPSASLPQTAESPDEPRTSQELSQTADTATTPPPTTEKGQPPADENLPQPDSEGEKMEVCVEQESKSDIESNLQENSGDVLSADEIRWKQYSSCTDLVYVPGQPESSKLESEFTSFKYWREPVPTLDLESILQEVRQSEPNVNKTKGCSDSSATAAAGSALVSASTTLDMVGERQAEAAGSDTDMKTAVVSDIQQAELVSAATGEDKAAFAALTQLAALIKLPEPSTPSTDTTQNTPPGGTATSGGGGGFMFGSLSSPTGSLAGMVRNRPPNQTYASVLSSSGSTNQQPTSSSHSRNISISDSSGDESATTLSELIAKQQDIIPPLLLENYLSMTDPSRAQTVDSDIAQHCAYSLPAVAFTLGKDNWRCLKCLYQTLVTDMQWKVRRTLAYSIHELAVILGPQLTHSDLIPIFNDFIKDLDEVRIGVLAHLADFLKLLNGPARKHYLSKLPEFMKTDNSRVWRARLDLAQQLVKMIDLYSAQDVVDHIVPIAMCLLTDSIADVRTASLSLISRVLRLLHDPTVSQLRLMVINDLIEKLAYNNQWHARQTFVKACHRVLKERSLELDQFSKELLPSVLTLGEDKIPNVRLAVAHLMSQCLLPTDYFTSNQNPHHDDLLQLEARLKNDRDQDVRYYAKLSVQGEFTHLSNFTDMIDV